MSLKIQVYFCPACRITLTPKEDPEHAKAHEENSQETEAAFWLEMWLRKLTQTPLQITLTPG